MLEFSDRKTVLVVDDTPDDLILLSQLLSDEYRVLVCDNGDKALRIATAESPPDIILLDIMMPGMDGYEVCQHLKLDPVSVNIPVIFVTAKDDVEDEERGLALGAVDYITKPISPAILKARLRTHLRLKQYQDELEDLLIQKMRVGAAAFPDPR
jgi:putative two-component system response regulator